MASLAQPAVRSDIEAPHYLQFGATMTDFSVQQTADALIAKPPEVGLDISSDFSEVIQKIVDGIKGDPVPVVCVVNHCVDPASGNWEYSLDFGVNLVNGYPRFLTNEELLVGRGSIVWAGRLGANERVHMDLFIAAGYVGDGRPAIVILNPGTQDITHLRGDSRRIMIVDSKRQFASAEAMKKVPARNAA